MAKTGIDLFLDLLADHGVRYIFGNPGSTELPLNDALTRDGRIQYILGLQESLSWRWLMGLVWLQVNWEWLISMFAQA